MITVREIRQKAENKYHQYLEQCIQCIVFPQKEHLPFFPLVIRSDKGNVADDFASRSKELAELNEASKASLGRGYSLNVREINSRLNAKQTMIDKIYFESEDDYLSFIGRKSEAARVKSALSVFMQSQFFPPDELYAWALLWLNVLKQEQENEFWQNIILCATWLKGHSHSSLYIREIPLTVHTKFIEDNKRLIHSLISRERFISFEKQHGLRDKPLLVHFRSLSMHDPLHIGQQPVSEVILPLEDFINLPRTGLLDDVCTVFIIENEIVYLTFPHVEHAVCIWGAGYEVNVLSPCTFLNNYNLRYFGDLDEHGYDMLSMCRLSFPKTESFCMDAETLAVFDDYRVAGKMLPLEKIPGQLTSEELSVFMKLRALPERSRLEQERISYAYLTERVRKGV
jgi:hypothetical protein